MKSKTILLSFLITSFPLFGYASESNNDYRESLSVNISEQRSVNNNFVDFIFKVKGVSLRGNANEARKSVALETNAIKKYIKNKYISIKTIRAWISSPAPQTIYSFRQIKVRFKISQASEAIYYIKNNYNVDVQRTTSLLGDKLKESTKKELFLSLLKQAQDYRQSIQESGVFGKSDKKIIVYKILILNNVAYSNPQVESFVTSLESISKRTSHPIVRLESGETSVSISANVVFKLGNM